MPDQKISDLGDGGAPQDDDQFVVARGATNNKLAWSSLSANATAGNIALTAAGNTAGALALVSSGTLTLAGGNNITLSQAGNAITISGATAAGAAGTAISGIANSQTTYTSGTVSLSEQGALTIRSTTGQAFQFSVPATSSLSATGIVSISTNGSTISIGAVGGAGLQAGMSTLGNTSGDTGYASDRLNLVGGNNITLSGSTDAGSMSLTISGANFGGAQTGISGIVGSDATYTSGTVTFTGVGGGVTVGSNTGQRIDISVAAQSVQPETQTFVSGISASDTLYTSGNVRFTGVGGGITVSSNTGQRVDLSVAAQSVQPETQTFIGGISASNTLYTSGSVRFTGSQAVTVRSGTGQLVVIDAPAQSVQPETQTFIAGIQNSQTTYTSGTVNLSVVAGNLTIRSTTGQAFQFSASQTVQPETQTFLGALAASNTTYTSGTVTITGVGGGITVSSNTGQRIDLSVAAQTTQTQGILSAGVSTGGNTAGNTQVSTGSRLVFVGSNGITASQGTAAGATTITLSGATQTVQTQGILSAGVSTGGNTAGNTQVSTGSRFVLVATGNATASQATAAGASTVTISVGTQTVQTQDVLSVGASNIGNTSGNTTVNTGSRLVLAGGNNITLSQSTAAGATTLTISGANVEGAQTGISGIANSETTYTSGSVTMSELGAITIRSTTGQQFQFSVNPQTAQTQSLIQALYDGANSITTGTVRLTNANGVSFSVNAQTLSASVNESISMFAVSNTTQSTSGTAHKSALSFGGAGVASVGVTGGSVVVSVPAGAGQTGISGIANSQTTYTSGTVSLSELGAITIRSTTGNQYQLSVNAQSVQPETQTFLGGIQNSQTTYTSGTVNLSVNGGLLTIRSTTGQAFQFSVSQSVQPETQTAISGIANSQTTYTSGTVSLSELGAITIRSTTGNQYQLSVNAQTTQTQGILSAGASNLGNTAGNTTVNTGSRLVFVGTNMVSLSQTTGAGATTLSINATQSVQTQDVLSAGVSNVGNTAGNTTVNTGSRLVLAGGNNITLSQSTAAGATTITVSAPNLGAGAMSAGASNLGNTAGDTGITGTQLVLVGSNNITLSQATGANGGTLSIIGGGGGGFSAGMSTEGNTAGNTGVTGTRLVLVGSGPIYLSQTTDANGGTLSITGAVSTLSATGGLQISSNGSTISIGAGGLSMADWQNMPAGQAALQTHIASISKTPFYFNEVLPYRITANSVVFRISMVTASQPLSLSAHMGIYTKVNSTSMALLGSFSEAYVVSSGSSVSFSGVRNLVMTGIGTHTALSVLSMGNYGIGMMFSAGATASMNASLMGASTVNGPLGILLPGTNSMSTGTSQGAQALWGRGSTTVNAMPANVVRSELVNQGSGASVQLHPWLYIRS